MIRMRIENIQGVDSMTVEGVIKTMPKEISERNKVSFLNKNEFSLMIETLASQNEDISYIETIAEYCTNNNIEIEAVTRLLSKNLLKKIEIEAENLNLLHKKKRRKRAKL